MYTQQRYILMTLDPVHVGTGGYRLGRVDLSIAREPGTNLPKIPGTSLSGAVRSYAAMRYQKRTCAGQGSGTEKHCGKATCPICYTFGAIRGTEGGNAGTVSIADAQLLLFPVHSMAGPVWVSTAARLDLTGFPNLSGLKVGEFVTTLKDSQGQAWARPLNLGWLLLTPKQGNIPDTPPNAALKNLPAWEAVAKRLVLVDDGLFSQIVNSNLEVRTSVSIDPLTGAAAEGALFTYEALPRATWLWCDVVEDDYRLEKFPQDDPQAREFKHARPLDVVRAGLQLAEHLGVGGMGTRGFGRIKVVADWEVERG